MPIHDWTRAPTGYFHHFQQHWSVAICTALGAGLLPKGGFALLERQGGALEPDLSRVTADEAYAAKANRIVLHRLCDRDRITGVQEESAGIAGVRGEGAGI